ncbi:class IV lanthionine synthetase LanL [Streptomyces sp. NPDC008150]|uniref:class IV lanthionine synthetase LanL n=1 Tax=Streptomyces sp. NPDC008150 TaxID=3364816 RepID=UPI0036E9E522
MSSLPLRLLVGAVLDELAPADWETTEDGVWCRVTCASARERVQGWKLHVSATALSAPHVLYRAARVLVAEGCSFKYARTVELADEMTSASYDRAQCGKFLTAYPADDDQLRRLAEKLDLATAGLPGPAILSDRALRPGSLVHYRYGAFAGVPVLNDDGCFEARLREPGGAAVPDARKPWFCPPAWTTAPFPGPAARSRTAPAAPAPVLLDERFVVKEAVRHSARGGVYRALDEHTGAEVVVKQARAHVGGHLTGDDARVLLRREAAMLTALSGLCPEVVHQFEKDGHAFLVMECVSGRTLAAWVRERCADLGPGVDAGAALALASRLTALLAGVHERGYVYQDFSPNNIMVGDDGRLRLVDPEWAAPAGTWTYRAFTPGFGAPEQRGPLRRGPVHGPAVDLYALGGVLCYLATGVVPAFAADDEDRPAVDRVRTMLAMTRAERPAVVALEPAVLGLLAERPEDRWSLRRLAGFLDRRRTTEADKWTAEQPSSASAEPVREAVPARGTAGGTRSSARVTDHGSLAELLADGLTYLDRAVPATADGRADRWAPGSPPEGDGATAAGTARATGTPWRRDGFAASTDPCAVQHGTAGVLAVLDSAAGVLHRPDLTAAVARLARWTGDRALSVPRVLPGLYFGRSGTAWALHAAAARLGDESLARTAEQLALAVPVRWHNPDVCHGAAGAGLAQVYFHDATGDEVFLDRVTECADGLVAAAETAGGRTVWPVPRDADSQLAGARHLGFAHGVAGIASFLLEAARVTGTEAYADLAAAAGDTLAAEAERGPWGARWRPDLDHEPGTGLLYNWCSGSSGVGTFLLRLWRVTGDRRLLDLAEEAGVAVHRSRWTASTAACHGIAGDGQFLLDLADELPGGDHADRARDLADVLLLRAVRRDGLLLVPDESGVALNPDQQTGVAGTVAFLLRLAHGGPRPWTPGALSVPASA